MNGFDERVLVGLRAFAAIAEVGSFAAAAERLGLSQPGVSRALARLEARLQVRLCDRTTRSVSLTEEGRRFHARVMPLIADLDAAVADASRGASAVRGRLRVNVDPFFSRLTLGPQLGVFLARQPELTLELVTREQVGDLVGSGFDLALRFGEPRESGLVARKLLETRILTVAAPSYLQRHGVPRHPDELADGRHACIEFIDPHSGRPFAWEFHQGRRRHRVATAGRLIVNDVGTMLSSCLAGYGVAQVMAFGTEQLIATGQLVVLFPQWSDERFALYALHPSRRRPPAKTTAFLDFVASQGMGS